MKKSCIYLKIYYEYYKSNMEKLIMKALESAESTLPISFAEKQGHIAPVYVEGESHEEWLDRLRSSFGAEYAASAEYLLNSLSTCITKKEGVATINGLVAAIAEMQPRDVIERTLVAEIVLAAQKAMRAIADCNAAPSAEDKAVFAAIATKMMRVSGQLAMALRRYKSSGEQTINVVYGNAIVGDVHAEGRG
jgi:hypothetical protein